MKILLIRHAIAEEQEVFARTGRSDDERPLTDEGREAMRDAARGLAKTVKDIDVIAASPLVRAVQTADVVADEFPHAARETIDAMKPEAQFPEFVEWLSGKRDEKCVAAVGHNPHISALACWLIGAPDSAVDMKKGSALLLEFEREPAAGGATLQWFMKPGQLSRLKKR